MTCHICTYWTPEKGCDHYGPEKVQHTPGPWKYSPHFTDQPEGHIFLEGTKDGEACCIDLTGAAAMTQEQLNANGRLMAAAPRLLKLLKEHVFNTETLAALMKTPESKAELLSVAADARTFISEIENL